MWKQKMRSCIWVNVSFDFRHVGLVNTNGYFYNRGSKVAKRTRTGIISLVTHAHETLKCCLTFIGNCKSGLDYLKSSRALENVLAKCRWVLWSVLLCTELWKWAMQWSYLRISLKQNIVLAKKKSKNLWFSVCHLCRYSCKVHQGECMLKEAAF